MNNHLTLLTQARLAELAAWWNRLSPRHRLSRALLAEKIFADPDYRPEHVFFCQEQGRPLALATLVVRENRSAFIKLLMVDDRHRGRGLGRRILQWAEARARRYGAEHIGVFDAAPNYLLPGVPQEAVDLRGLLEHNGYREIGRSLNMGVVLEPFRDKTIAKPRAFTVARARAQDFDEVMVFLKQNWPTWRAEVALTFQRRPRSLFLAWHGRQLVAFAAYDANNVGCGWFGPMGCHNAFRRRGLGACLLQMCLKDMAISGLPNAVIAWVSDSDFYQRHGRAKPLAHFVRLRKILN